MVKKAFAPTTEGILIIGGLLAGMLFLVSFLKLGGYQITQTYTSAEEGFINALQDKIDTITSFKHDTQINFNTPVNQFSLTTEGNTIFVKFPQQRTKSIITSLNLVNKTVKDQNYLCLRKAGDRVSIDEGRCPDVCDLTDEFCDPNCPVCDPVCLKSNDGLCAEACSDLDHNKMIDKRDADNFCDDDCWDLNKNYWHFDYDCELKEQICDPDSNMTKTSYCSKTCEKENKICDYDCMLNNMPSDVDCPPCNFNGICEQEECKTAAEICKDCIGPSDLCIGDGFCNTVIGENCENSKEDCMCEKGACCPDSIDADVMGCSVLDGLKEGEKCWCSPQCENGIQCNPTMPPFKDYENACCKDGLSWDGEKCDVPECRYPCMPNCILPKAFDWRNYQNKNWLNPIRNQQKCGSCWAFSTIGAVENVYNVEKSLPATNKDLSEQDLVSCSSAGSCRGGWPHEAMRYTRSSGVCDESCFPYTASDKSCSRCSDVNSRLWKIKSYNSISGRDNIKRALICQGPLSVASMGWLHAIVLVAYDDESDICKSKYGKDGCWVIRNSWGVINGNVMSVWHQGGYGYIPYEGHSYSDLASYVYGVKEVTSP